MGVGLVFRRSNGLLRRSDTLSFETVPLVPSTGDDETACDRTRKRGHRARPADADAARGLRGQGTAALATHPFPGLCSRT